MSLARIIPLLRGWIAMTTLLAALLLGYVAMGLLFAPYFAFWRAGDLLDETASFTRPVRLLLLPGSALLWPWLLVRLVRRTNSRSSDPGRDHA